MNIIWSFSCQKVFSFGFTGPCSSCSLCISDHHKPRDSLASAVPARWKKWCQYLRSPAKAGKPREMWLGWFLAGKTATFLTGLLAYRWKNTSELWRRLIWSNSAFNEIGREVLLISSAIICPMVVKTGLSFRLLSQNTKHTTSVRMIPVVSSKHLANPMDKSGKRKCKKHLIGVSKSHVWWISQFLNTVERPSDVLNRDFPGGDPSQLFRPKPIGSYWIPIIPMPWTWELCCWMFASDLSGSR